MAHLSRVQEYLQNTAFAGRVVDPDVIGGANVEGRAPEAIIFLKLEQGRISQAGFQSSGCGYLIACCAALLEQVLHSDVRDAQKRDETWLADYLGGLPEAKLHCATLAIAALRNALAKVSAPPLSEESDE